MRVRTVILLILALILVSFFAGNLMTFKKRNAAYGQVMALTDSITAYTVVISELETQVFEKQQVIGTQEQAIAAGLLEVDRLKKLNMKHLSQITKLEGQLHAAISDIAIPDTMFITDTIEVGSGEAKSYLKLPFSTGYSDQYLWLDFGVGEDKKGWFDMDAHIPLTITLGDRKGSPIASVSTPSPYIRITDFNVVNIQEQKWYMKPWLPWAGGAAGGLLAGWAIWGR